MGAPKGNPNPLGPISERGEKLRHHLNSKHHFFDATWKDFDHCQIISHRSWSRYSFQDDFDTILEPLVNKLTLSPLANANGNDYLFGTFSNSFLEDATFTEMGNHENCYLIL
jgi:hypothetical protein